MKTKIISLILALTFVFSAFLVVGVTVSAASDTTQTEISADLAIEEVWCNPGETVEIDLAIANNPSILGATLTVSWDEELTLLSDTSGAAFSYMSYVSPSRYLSYGSNFIWYGNEAENATNGTILTLKFKVSETAQRNDTLPINVTYVERDVIDKNENNVKLNISNGGVHVLSYVPGDVTDDGYVNIRDLVRLSQYISDGGKTDPEGYNAAVVTEACDVNADGRINILDLVRLSQYVSDGSKTDPDGYNVKLLPGKVAEKNDPGLTYVSNGDGTCYVSGIGTCTDTAIVIPKKSPSGDIVTKIGDSAFNGCTSLASITVPNSVTSIGYGAFDGCTSLAKVYYGGTADQRSSINIDSYNYDLTSAFRYYYSETEPTVKGNYWHYVNGVPTPWKEATSKITPLVVDATGGNPGDHEINDIATVTKRYFAVSYTMIASAHAGAINDNGCCGLAFGGSDDNCILIPYDGETTGTQRSIGLWGGAKVMFGKWWGYPDFGSAYSVDIDEYVDKEVTILVLGEMNDGMMTLTAYINGTQVQVWNGGDSATAQFSGKLQWITWLSGQKATVLFYESDTMLDSTVFD